MKENEEILMENVTPEDLPTEEQQQEKAPFVPSPKWKRIFAWFLFVVVIVSIITWLLSIAWPNWTDVVKDWAKGLLS